MGLVRHEGQHDEVGVQAVQTVALVGGPGPLGVAPRPAYVLHDLVLPLPRHVVPFWTTATNHESVSSSVSRGSDDVG